MKKKGKEVSIALQVLAGMGECDVISMCGGVVKRANLRHTKRPVTAMKVKSEHLDA